VTKEMSELAWPFRPFQTFCFDRTSPVSTADRHMISARFMVCRFQMMKPMHRKQLLEGGFFVESCVAILPAAHVSFAVSDNPQKIV
jgi:hypothetical protein